MPAIYGCEFKCRDDSRCIWSSSRCDGYRDCADGSDEALCCKVEEGSPKLRLEESKILSQLRNGECKEAGFMRCDEKCIPEKRRCDGVVDCTDMTDESYCCDGVSSLVSKSSSVTRRYPKTSSTRYGHVMRKTTAFPYWRHQQYDDDDDDDYWSLNRKKTVTPFNFPDLHFTIPTVDFNGVTVPSNVYGEHYGSHDLNSGAVSGIVVAVFLILGCLLAVLRCFLVQRRVERYRTISTQSLITDQRVSSPSAARLDNEQLIRVGSAVLGSPAVDRRRSEGPVHGSRTVLIRTRSTSDLRSGDDRPATSSTDAPAGSQPQQQQQQQQRTADALHLMVRDGPWLTTRTLRPMIPEQPNIPLFIEESSVRRLDDRRGVVVSTPPQLMMYVDGEFVWIPASRVPEALNFILPLLSLQTEEGPSPATPEQIQDLPIVAVRQETVDAGGRCNVCLEDFILDEQVRELPCHHLYHSDCIIQWLQLNGTCPACRESVSGQQNDAEDRPTDVTQ